MNFAILLSFHSSFNFIQCTISLNFPQSSTAPNIAPALLKCSHKILQPSQFVNEKCAARGSQLLSNSAVSIQQSFYTEKHVDASSLHPFANNLLTTLKLFSLNFLALQGYFCCSVGKSSFRKTFYYSAPSAGSVCFRDADREHANKPKKLCWGNQ